MLIRTMGKIAVLTNNGTITAPITCETIYTAVPLTRHAARRPLQSVLLHRQASRLPRQETAFYIHQVLVANLRDAQFTVGHP